MAIDLYRLSVGTFLRQIENLDKLLAKAQAHVTEGQSQESDLLAAKLAPDMFGFAKQVQLVSDFAKSVAGRLAGAELPRFEDNETTLAELRERLAKTVAYLRTLQQASFEGAETREIEVPGRDRTLHFVGDNYLLNFGLPNFYFHYTTAYDILRNRGLEIGKRDYVGQV
jgi:hypothetical protein